MEDFFDTEKAKALVYLSSENDKDNKVMISDEHLEVTYRKKKRVYPIKSIQALKTERVKFLFPLVVGGILTPFAFLSFFIDPYYPWVHLIAILTGMLLFYLGFSGKESFTIVKKKGEEIRHYLPDVSKNLEAFIDFVNPLLKENPYSNEKIYFEVKTKDEGQFFGEINSDRTIFPVFGYTFIQLKKNNSGISEENFLCVDPMKTRREIKFQFDPETNTMRPVLDGPVPREALIKPN